jgi:hypothetical protein
MEWWNIQHFLSFVNSSFGDSLGVRISSESVVEWINKNSLKEFACGILTKPVRIQDSIYSGAQPD